MVNVEFERATSNVLSSEWDVAFERYVLYHIAQNSGKENFGKFK